MRLGGRCGPAGGGTAAGDSRPGAINRGARQPRAGAAAGRRAGLEGARGRGAAAAAAAGRAAVWAHGGPPAAAGARADGPGPGATARTTGPCGPPALPAAATCSASGPRPGESRRGGPRGARGKGGGQSKALSGGPASEGPRLGTWPGLSGPHSPSRPRFTVPYGSSWPLRARGPQASGNARRKDLLGGGFQGPEGFLISRASLPPHGSPHTCLLPGLGFHRAR